MATNASTVAFPKSDEVTSTMSPLLNVTAQRICVWCGPVMIVVWGLSFVFAKLIPPPAPSASGAEIVRLFAENAFALKLGLILSVFSCALLVPFCAVISAQMRRMEGVRDVLAQTQFASGALLCVEFLIPFGIWQTAVYRIDEWSTEIVMMLNTMAWLMFLGIISSACIQVASLGLAILLDKGKKPVFPRWVGFYNIWTAILWIPAGTIVFFKDGPFAWNGVIAWWVPLTIYLIWFGIMVVYLLKAINEDEQHQRTIVAERPTLVA